MTDFNIQTYLTEILKDAGEVSKEDVEAAKRLLAHDKVASKVKETVLMRSDYSRNQDQLKKLEDEAKAKMTEVEALYQSVLTSDHNNKDYVAKLEAQIKNGDDNLDPDPPARDFLTKKDLDEVVGKLQKDAVKVTSLTVKLAQRYRSEFNKDLDPDQLIDYAVKSSLPLETAYDGFTKSEREAKAQIELEEKIAAARKEGAQEAASKFGFPLPTVRPRGIHALQPMGDIPRTSRDRVSAAVAAFNKGEA